MKLTNNKLLNVNNTLFNDNGCNNQGGAIYLENYNKTLIENVNFTNNNINLTSG